MPHKKGEFSIIEKLGPIVKSTLEEKTQNPLNFFKPSFRRVTKKFVDQYGFFKFRESIRYAYATSPFYNKLFKQNNLRPKDIRSFKDISKIPFTTPENLQENPKSFFSLPEDRFIKVFSRAKK